MTLVIHIITAIASLVWTGIVYFYPSKPRLNVAYGLAAAMLVSGFSLILSKPAHMTQTCLEGLVFLAIISYGIIATRQKLAAVTNK